VQDFGRDASRLRERRLVGVTVELRIALGVPEALRDAELVEEREFHIGEIDSKRCTHGRSGVYPQIPGPPPDPGGAAGTWYAHTRVRYWELGLVTGLLEIAVLLGVIAWVRRRFAVVRRLGIPDAFLAGALGLALGPTWMQVLPTDSVALEPIVYHAFGVMFIAVALQRPPVGERSGGTRSIAIAIPTAAILQILLGLLLVALLAFANVEGTHAGHALMVMLGLSQGPGQALSLGAAWEPFGLVDGAQIGLGFAAAGFVLCGLIGVPLVAWGKRRGLVSTAPAPSPAARAPEDTGARQGLRMDALATQVVAIGCVYAATYGLLALLTWPVPESKPLHGTLWGFHFIVGALLALGTRRLAPRLGFDDVFDDRILGSLSVIAVDVTTTAAIAAIVPEVLSRVVVPLLVLTIAVSIGSLFLSLWLARRAFPEAPFEHAVGFFGMCTGTLATGLALLRTIDPRLEGPASRNMVLGAAASVPVTAPLMLGVLPYAVGLWPQGLAVSVLLPAGILVLYLTGLAIAWRTLTPFTALRPWTALWPKRDPT
jgi:ESS family glutamate:Na+ symporter